MPIKIFRQKIIFVLLWIVMPLLLLVGGLTISLLQLHRQQIGLLTLTKDYPVSLYKSFKKDELLANEKVTGNFIASDNYLGILSVRFETHLRINDDQLIFRIKEFNDKDWYYQNKYKVDQFQPNQLFPFGFPIINNSEGKKYSFEIESTQGEIGNAVSVDPTYPAFQARYKYPKEIIFNELEGISVFIRKKISSLKSEGIGKSIRSIPGYLRNKVSSENENIKISLDTTSKFAKRKLINLTSDIEFNATSLFYLMPAALYVLWIASIRIIKSKPYLFALIPPIFMIVESLILKNSYDSIELGITIIWIVMIMLYKLGPTISWVLSIIYLMMSMVFFYTGYESTAEKFGSWTLITIITGILSQIYETTYNLKLHTCVKYLQLLCSDFKRIITLRQLPLDEN